MMNTHTVNGVTADLLGGRMLQHIATIRNAIVITTSESRHHADKAYRPGVDIDAGVIAHRELDQAATMNWDHEPTQREIDETREFESEGACIMAQPLPLATMQLYRDLQAKCADLLGTVIEGDEWQDIIDLIMLIEDADPQGEPGTTSVLLRAAEIAQEEAEDAEDTRPARHRMPASWTDDDILSAWEQGWMLAKLSDGNIVVLPEGVRFTSADEAYEHVALAADNAPGATADYAELCRKALGLVGAR